MCSNRLNSKMQNPGASDRCSSLQMASPSRGERSRGHYQEERSRACCWGLGVVRQAASADRDSNHAMVVRSKHLPAAFDPQLQKDSKNTICLVHDNDTVVMIFVL